MNNGINYAYYFGMKIVGFGKIGNPSGGIYKHEVLIFQIDFVNSHREIFGKFFCKTGHLEKGVIFFVWRKGFFKGLSAFMKEFTNNTRACESLLLGNIVKGIYELWIKINLKPSHVYTIS